MLNIRDGSVYGCCIFLTCSLLLVLSNTEVIAADQSAPNTEKEYIYLPLALSIVPQVSPVEYEPNEVPHLSFNLLAGYYAKLDGFELGGLANLETEEVYGVQIAGLTNVVGGRVKGFQAAISLVRISRGYRWQEVQTLPVGVSGDSKVLLDLTWVAISTVCNSAHLISLVGVSVEHRLVLSISPGA